MLSAANDFFVYILMSRRSRVLLKYMCKEKMCRFCRRRRASSRQRSMVTIEETRLQLIVKYKGRVELSAVDSLK